MAEREEIAHSDLIRDLRLLREKGLWRLRELTLPALESAGRAVGLNLTEDASPTAVEALLRKAVDQLGDEDPGTAAKYLFGLIRGTAGVPPTDLRERAASQYQLAPETFRKEPERRLIGRIADEILSLCLTERLRDAVPPTSGAPSAAATAIDVVGTSTPGSAAAIGRDQFTVGRDQINVYGNETVNIHISQVTAVPPPAPGCALPPDTPSFTGRDDELRQLLDPHPVHDSADSVPVVYAIDGMPGVGKTALAVHAAHRLAAGSDGTGARFTDGIFFLDLRAHTPSHMAMASADALASLLIADGVDPQYLPENLTERSAMWRNRLEQREVLLVLDNAADSAQVAPLLPGWTGCLTLITSRRRLGDLAGDVRPLSLDVLSSLAARVMFLGLVSRARTAGRAVRPDEADELVTLATFLPLAISLLARVFLQHVTWSMRDLINETEGRLLTMTAEHATVAAAFDLSYELLPPARQQFFRRIGLHPGVDLDASSASTLGGVSREEAIFFLDSLHRDHLLIEIGYRRYGLHDLIRSYLIARSTEDPVADRQQALIRLLDYYQSAAELARGYLARQTQPTRSRNVSPPAVEGRSPQSQPLALTGATAEPERPDTAGLAPDLTDRSQALAWLRVERANLLALIEPATSVDPARGVALVAEIAELLRLDGPWGDATELHRSAAATAGRLGDAFGEAVALANLGQIRVLSGDMAVADDAFERARDLFHECGDPLGEANALAGRGYVHYRNAHYDDASIFYEQALELYQRLGDRRGEANCLTELGNVYYRIGKPDEALDAMERALALHHELGHAENEAFTLMNLGIVHYRVGRVTDSAATLRNAVELCQQIGDRRGEANALTYLGAILRIVGDPAGVIEALNPALELHRSLGHRLGVANTLIYLGSANLLLGEVRRAEELLIQTLLLFRELEDPLGEANAQLYLGVLHRDDGELQLAEAELRYSSRLYNTLGDSGGEVEAINELGTLYRLQDNLDLAVSYHVQALELARRIDSTWDEGHAAAGLGRCAFARGNVEVGSAHFRDAIDIFRKMGVPEADKISAEHDRLCTRDDDDDDDDDPEELLAV